MARRRISVTLDEDTVERARRSAGEQGLSSYVEMALQEKFARDAQQEHDDEDRRQAFLAWLDELDAADPPTEEERERGRRRAREIMAQDDADRARYAAEIEAYKAELRAEAEAHG